MRKFLKRGDNPDTYYSQSNNVTEAILKKASVKAWLESCGPTSAVMLLDAIGADIYCETPAGWQMQPEDVLFAWFNDPRNAAIQKQALGSWYNAETTFGNEISELYPLALQRVFNVSCKHMRGIVTLDIIKALIDANVGIMACLMSPGHFIAIVGYDDAGNVIYNDPWPNNSWPIELHGTPGFNRVINWLKLADNLKPYCVSIG
jgi:hypothetical protein